MKILLSTWGSPLNWRNSRYRGLGDQFRCPERDVFTPLPCYINGVDRVVIIALDSVIAASHRGYVNREALHCAGVVGLQIDSPNLQSNPRGELEGSVTIRPGVDNYRDWVEKARRYVKCVAGRAVERDVDVVIAPAMGRLGGYVYKPKEPGYFSTISLLEIYSLLKEVLSGITAIYLDVTHGINFMPTLTYLVARRLASLVLAGGRVGEVALQVLNAVQSGEDSYEIQRIHSERIRRIDLTVATSMKGNEARVVKALAMAAPLAIYEACRRLGDSYKPEEELEGYRRKVVIREHEVLWDQVEDVDRTYLKLLAKRICERGWSNRLEDIDHNYFLRASKLHQIFVNDELNDLRDLLHKKPQTGRIPYYKLRDSNKDENHAARERKKLEKPDDQVVRNFVAHAGLLDSIVEIDRRDGEVVLEYADPNLVMKFLDTKIVAEFI